MDAKDLTILLPLKGRHLHTLRFLWYANLLRLPYRFLIADGEVHPVTARLLENSADAFPYLDIEYVRYPDDTSYRHYTRKMANACARVRTPYVMHADNDDFLLPAGIEHCIAFLEEHKDYACCRAGVGGFELMETPGRLSDVIGSFKRVEDRYGRFYAARDIGADSAVERMWSGYGQQYVSSFYNAFRTDALRAIWDEIVELNLEGLRFIEPYFAMRTFVAGKVRADGGMLSYFRQYGTSMGAGREFRWAWDVFSPPYIRDHKAAVAELAGVVAQADQIDLALAEERVRATYHSFYKAQVHRGDGKILRSIRRRLKRFSEGRTDGERKKNSPRKSQSPAAELEALFVSLEKEGATDCYLAALQKELAAVEETLTGNTFVEFVRACAPEFLPTAEGVRA